MTDDPHRPLRIGILLAAIALAIVLAAAASA